MAELLRNRKFALDELIKTEKDYIDDLALVVNGYVYIELFVSTSIRILIIYSILFYK